MQSTLLHTVLFPLYLKSTVPVKLPVSVREGFWPTWSLWEIRKRATGLKFQKKVKRITKDFNKLHVCVGLAHNVCDVKWAIFYPAVVADDTGSVWPDTWDELLGSPPVPMPRVLSLWLSACPNLPAKPSTKRLARNAHPTPSQGWAGATPSAKQMLSGTAEETQYRIAKFLQLCSFAD